MIVADDLVLCPNKCGHKYKGNGKWSKYNPKNHLMYLRMQSIYRQFQYNIICYRSFVQKIGLKTHVTKIHKIVFYELLLLTLLYTKYTILILTCIQ